MSNRILPLSAALLAAALLAACHGDSSEAPQPTPVHRKTPMAPKKGPTAEELTVGMVEAVPLGKSTLPMSVKFDLPDRPTLGQPLEVVVALLPQVAGSASIQVTSTEGLTLAPEAASIAIPSVEPTQAYRVSIGTTPTAEGVQLLNLNVTLTHDEATEARSFSVPVIVAAGPVAVTQR
jgi:hypothetical protein